MRTATTVQRPGTGCCSRRTALRAGALAAVAATPLAGCDFLGGRSAAPPVDPLAPLVTSATELADRYDAAIGARPQLAGLLRPVADAHRAHAADLARVAGTTPPPANTGAAASGPPGAGGTSAPGADVKALLANLRAAELEGRKAAEQACLAAPADRAALLGSIAAARTTHLEMLR